MFVRLFVMTLGTFVTGVCNFVLSGLIPSVAADFDASIGLTGQVFTVYAITYGLGAPVLGAATGVVPWRLLLSGAMGLLCLGCCIAMLSVGLWMLMLGYFVMAFGAALFLPGIAAATVLIVPAHLRATAVGTVLGGALVAMALGGPIGMWLVGFGGWRSIFMINAIVAGLIALALFAVIPAGLPRAMASVAERIAAVRRPEILHALAVIALKVCGTYVVFIYLSTVVGAGPDPRNSHMGSALLTLGLAALAGSFAGGQAADRLGLVFSQTSFFGLAALAMAGVSVVNHVMGIGQAMPLVLALVALWGFGFWGGYPAHIGRLVSLAPDLAAVTLSVNATALYAGIASGSVIGAQVLSHASAASLGFTGAAITCGALALLHTTSGTPRRA